MPSGFTHGFASSLRREEEASSALSFDLFTPSPCAAEDNASTGEENELDSESGVITPVFQKLANRMDLDPRGISSYDQSPFAASCGVSRGQKPALLCAAEGLLYSEDEEPDSDVECGDSQLPALINGTLRNPTLQDFKDRVYRPIVKYGRLVMDRTGRAMCRRVRPNDYTLAEVGRIFGLNHSAIRNVVENAYHDDLNEDPKYLSDEFSRAFPYRPPVLARPRPKKAEMKKTSRPVISSSMPSKRAASGRTASRRDTQGGMASSAVAGVKRQRPSSLFSTDASASGRPFHPGRSSEIDDMFHPRETKIARTQITTPPTGRPVEIVLKSSALRPLNVTHGVPRPVVASQPREPRPPNPPFTGDSAELQPPNSRLADDEEWIALMRFLRNAKGFDLTRYSDDFAEVGFTSIQDAIAMANLPKSEVEETVAQLFETRGMTKLHQVSLSNAIKDLARVPGSASS
ncbi:hypothetical protein C8R43DRAFT_1139626 [Mycena crocata]|nr:hypothetical protein C8R43DRAFT_1139626 [Mycena crocata]